MILQLLRIYLMRDQDKIEYYIIANGKFVSKEILDKFIPENRRPEQMVLQDNQFMQFLRDNDSDLLNRFKQHLKSIDKCSLTQEGTYLHQKNDQYVIFSSYQMGLYIKNGKNNGYKGFNYRFQQSLYIGDFKQQVKSNGQGKILIADKTNDKVVWHIFDGDWYKGQIVQGERISYQNYKEKQGFLIKYNGGFKNFQFDGQGTREIPGKKTYKGEFKDGKKLEKADKKQNLILLDFQDDEIEGYRPRRPQPDQPHQGHHPNQQIQPNIQGLPEKKRIKKKRESPEIKENDRLAKFKQG